MLRALSSLFGGIGKNPPAAEAQEVRRINVVDDDVLHLHQVFAFINRNTLNKNYKAVVDEFFTRAGKTVAPEASLMEVREIGQEFMLSSRAVLYYATIHRREETVLVVEITHVAKNQVVSSFQLKTAIIAGREWIFDIQ